MSPRQMANGPRTDLSFVLRVTQEQITRAIGVSRETVNRHLRDLQSAGRARISRGCIRAASLEDLEDLIF